MHVRTTVDLHWSCAAQAQSNDPGYCAQHRHHCTHTFHFIPGHKINHMLEFAFFYVCRELGLVTLHIRRTLHTFHFPFSSTSCPFFPTLSSHVWLQEAMCPSAVYRHNDAVCLLWPSLHINKSTLLLVHNCKSTKHSLVLI